jgi:hypothetical protein
MSGRGGLAGGARANARAVRAGSRRAAARKAYGALRGAAADVRRCAGHGARGGSEQVAAPAPWRAGPVLGPAGLRQSQARALTPARPAAGACGMEREVGR